MRASINEKPLSQGEFNKQLHENLCSAFNLAELKTLCLNLDIIYENIPGETLDEKMAGFVKYINRHNLYRELLPILKKERHTYKWPSYQPSRDASNSIRSKPSHVNQNIDTRFSSERTMILIPEGEYIPGYKPSFWSRLIGLPPKKVFVKEFFIDKKPVTNGEYAEFIKANPGIGTPFHWKGKLITIADDLFYHPVVNVSWENAKAYAKWVGKRLPTIHEWEKAARGSNDARTYPWGDDVPTINGGYCNYGKTSKTKKIAIQTTKPGIYSHTKNSPYGCIDMSGNVQEWTSEQVQRSSGNYAGLKGGSWATPHYYLLIGHTHYEIISKTANDIGFRLVKD